MSKAKKLLLGRGMKTEDGSDFAHAARMASKEGKKEFEFQGKTYPVTVDEDENEDLEEQYIYESDSQLPESILDSAYATDDGIFTFNRQTKNINLDSNYGYVNTSGWSNSEGHIAGTYQGRDSFRIPQGTPIFALKKAASALSSVNFSGKSNWRVFIGKIPNNSKNRGKYSNPLIKGLGFILETQDKSDQNFINCTKALIAAGFHTISWDLPEGLIGCAIPERSGTALRLAATEKANSQRPGHPVYHLHKEKIAGFRQGRHILFHRSSYGNLPIVSSSVKFTSTVSNAAQVDLHPKLAVRKNFDDRENDIFGDYTANLKHFKDYTFTIPDLNNLAKNPQAARTPEQKDFVQSYGLVSGKAASVSTGVEVTMSEPETESEDDVIEKGLDQGEGILSQIQRFLNLGSNVQNIWSQVSGAALTISGFAVRNRVPISISGVLALAIAGPFLFRLYLKSRKNIQNTRRNMKDPEVNKLIKQELGLDVQKLKDSMTDKELKALIQSIEKEETRNPETRRLYDL